MRLFPTLAAALVSTSLIAACNRGTRPTTDTPQGDQAIEQPADIPSASTSSETNAALNSTAPLAPAANTPAASASVSDATHSASAKTQTPSKRIAKRHHRKHSRSVAKMHRKHKNNPSARTRVRATTERVAVLDTPQSDTQADRAEFKREMQERVAMIANGVSGYHNQASITDSLTRYSQKIEDVKIADALARRQLLNIDTVSNQQWPSFKSNFQTQISQLEQDYQGIKQASR